MKQRLLANIFLMAMAAISLTGCNFVDIDTPGLVDSRKMFADEQGVDDALTGVYAILRKNELYGEQLSYGFIDEIAQLYYNNHQATPTSLTKTYDLRYLDKDVRGKIDRIWQTAYFGIYAINNILQHTDGKNFATLQRYRAEALALRAMLHFDILRLFAPNIVHPDAPAIPYVISASHLPSPRLTVAKCYRHIIADLETADYIFSTTSQKNRTPTEVYINGYTVKALLARVKLWGGEKEDAAKYARMVIDGPYRLVKEEQVLQLFMGYGAASECIWLLSSPKAYIDIRRVFYPARSTATCNMVRNSYKRLFNTSAFTPINNDYRFQAYFTHTNWGRPIVAFTKLYDKNYDETQEWQEGRMPGINLIRLPEMYYILAESVYETEPNAALEALNKVVTARGLLPLSLLDINTLERFHKIIVDEIKKEYWGEGQIFFTYKRLNLPMEGLDGKIFKASDDVYILPQPENEWQ